MLRQPNAIESRIDGRTTPIAPHTDWRGGFVGGSWMNGEPTQQSPGVVNCTANSAVMPCVSLSWPGGQVTVDGAVANPASGIRPW